MAADELAGQHVEHDALAARFTSMSTKNPPSARSANALRIVNRSLQSARVPLLPVVAHLRDANDCTDHAAGAMGRALGPEDPRQGEQRRKLRRLVDLVHGAMVGTSTRVPSGASVTMSISVSELKPRLSRTTTWCPRNAKAFVTGVTNVFVPRQGAREARAARRP